MAVTYRFVEDVEAEWPRLWPMIDGFQQHHVSVLEGMPRKNSEERALTTFTESLAAGRYAIIIGEDGSEPVAMGTVCVLDKGLTTPGAVGYISSGYVVPHRRGEGLSSRLLEVRKQWLRERGISTIENAVVYENSLAMAVWGHHLWGFIMRRPVPVEPPAESYTIPVRRVTDLDADWAEVWSLLQATAWADEPTTRAELAEAIQHRHRLVIAEGGLAFARISENPWLIVERICAIRELVVRDAAPARTTDALLAALEPWAARKGASHLQLGPIREDLAEPWFKRGFTPYMLRMSHPV